ncbi:sulfurtransferase [Arenimonas fontis]|uniref:Sulfurtransferase n=1 Tax=Arenimonas fontis TaxID=2608255 RepID=A0A5B2ZF45_9GAMM|nr:sulfurtransferase [Arenimonas fontis]KAA2285712.1 sulfurtransferase [Arenimonas fontis]
MSPLLSAQALRERLGRPGLVVVDCRHVLADADAGERAWRQARIPGAVHAHLDRDLCDLSRPASEGRHPLPRVGDFLALLERLGISPASDVVAYDDAGGAMAAARFWWLLRLLGHARVSVLDGGLAAWRAIGGPLERDEPRPPARGRYLAGFDHGQVAGTEEVLAGLGQAPGWLLDMRAPERYRGEQEPLDPVAGHIPGAVNRPFALNLEADGRFKPAEVLRHEYEALLRGRPPDQVLLYCGSGVTACHGLLAMEHAGLAGARIYAPSWSGWVSDRARPVETGEPARS